MNNQWLCENFQKEELNVVDPEVTRPPVAGRDAERPTYIAIGANSLIMHEQLINNSLG